MLEQIKGERELAIPAKSYHDVEKVGYNWWELSQELLYNSIESVSVDGRVPDQSGRVRASRRRSERASIKKSRNLMINSVVAMHHGPPRAHTPHFLAFYSKYKFTHLTRLVRRVLSVCPVPLALI